VAPLACWAARCMTNVGGDDYDVYLRAEQPRAQAQPKTSPADPRGGRHQAQATAATCPDTDTTMYTVGGYLRRSAAPDVGRPPERPTRREIWRRGGGPEVRCRAARSSGGLLGAVAGSGSRPSGGWAGWAERAWKGWQSAMIGKWQWRHWHKPRLSMLASHKLVIEADVPRPESTTLCLTPRSSSNRHRAKPRLQTSLRYWWLFASRVPRHGTPAHRCIWRDESSSPTRGPTPGYS